MAKTTIEEAYAIIREESVKTVKQMLNEGKRTVTVRFYGDNVDIEARLNPDFTWEWCE